jgi:hypothetical protein
MGKDLIYLVAYGFVVRRFSFFNRIVKQVVDEVVTGDGFRSLRLLRVERMLMLQLFNPVAFGC